MRIDIGEEGGGECDRDGYAGNFDALAREFIEGLALDFFGRKHRRSLLDSALEVLEGGLDFGKGWDMRGSGYGLSIAVVRVGGDAEGEGCFVLFFGGEVGVGETGELFANKEDHEACGERIKGACVANFLDTCFFAQGGDEAKRCFAARLVDEKNTLIINQGCQQATSGAQRKLSRLSCQRRGLYCLNTTPIFDNLKPEALAFSRGHLLTPLVN